MAFEIWGGYLAYGIGYALTAGFLIAYRKQVVGRTIETIRGKEHRQAAAA